MSCLSPVVCDYFGEDVSADIVGSDEEWVVGRGGKVQANDDFV